jgi:hypothetical protein
MDPSLIVGFRSTHKDILKTLRRGQLQLHHFPGYAQAIIRYHGGWVHAYSRRRVRVGVIYLAYHAYAAGSHPLTPLEAEPFEEYFARWVVSEFMSPTSPDLHPLALEELWQQMEGTPPKAGRQWLDDRMAFREGTYPSARAAV